MGTWYATHAALMTHKVCGGGCSSPLHSSMHALVASLTNWSMPFWVSVCVSVSVSAWMFSFVSVSLCVCLSVRLCVLTVLYVSPCVCLDLPCNTLGG